MEFKLIQIESVIDNKNMYLDNNKMIMNKSFWNLIKVMRAQPDLARSVTNEFYLIEFYVKTYEHRFLNINSDNNEIETSNFEYSNIDNYLFRIVPLTNGNFQIITKNNIVLRIDTNNDDEKYLTLDNESILFEKAESLFNS